MKRSTPSSLPELVQRQKIVVVVTHDDRYFHLAHRIIKIESGKVVEDRPPTGAPSQAREAT